MEGDYIKAYYYYSIIWIVLISCSMAYAFPVSIESQLTYTNGTVQVGTFTVNFTFINSSGTVIFSDVSSVTTNINGKFRKEFDFPYFANDTLRVRVNISDTDTGYVNVTHVLYSINSRYLQGKDLSYFVTVGGSTCPLNYAVQNITLSSSGLTTQCMLIETASSFSLSGDNVYLYNDTSEMHLNETKLNSTVNKSIDRRVTVGFLSALGFDITTDLKMYFDTLYQSIIGYYSNTEIDNLIIGNSSLKLDITDQRYNDTIAIQQINDSKLNVTDQRYNDTVLIVTLNTTIITLNNISNASIQELINANGNWSLDRAQYVNYTALDNTTIVRSGNTSWIVIAVGNYTKDRAQVAFKNQTNIFILNQTFSNITVLNFTCLNANCSHSIRFDGSDSVFAFLS